MHRILTAAFLALCACGADAALCDDAAESCGPAPEEQENDALGEAAIAEALDGSVYAHLVAAGELALVIATERGPALLIPGPIPAEAQLGPVELDEQQGDDVGFLAEAWREVRDPILGAAFPSQIWALYSAEGDSCVAQSGALYAVSWLEGWRAAPEDEGGMPLEAVARRVWEEGGKMLALELELGLDPACDAPVFGHVMRGDLSPRPVAIGRFSFDHLEGPAAERMLARFRSSREYREAQDEYARWRELDRGEDAPPHPARWEDFLGPGAYAYGARPHASFDSSPRVPRAVVAAIAGEGCGVFHESLWALGDANERLALVQRGPGPTGFVVLGPGDLEPNDGVERLVLLFPDGAWLERDDATFEQLSATPPLHVCPC